MKKNIVKLFCKAIRKRRVLRFFYESSSGTRWRIIRPYMILPNQRGNLELVGTPTEELIKPLEKRQPGHYLISTLEMVIKAGQFEILSETFDDPGVPRNIVDNTKSKVVCRFIYDDENEAEVISKWIKI